jgi:broad specificity phosphatase PhoE
MTFYFVRHAQSTANISKTHQSPTVELSPTGIQQAEALANHFKHISVDIILSSTFTRALQTAQKIHEVTKIRLDVDVVDMLRETQKPSEIFGLKHEHPQAVAIKQILKANRHNPRYRYSNEETTEEIYHRALQVLKILLSINKKHIIVVTHQDFLKMLILVMIKPEPLDMPLYERIEPFLKINNASVTTIEFTNKFLWQMSLFNDISFLPTNLRT